MKKILPISIVLVLIGLILGALFCWNNLRGIWPAVKDPPRDISDLISDNSNGNQKTGENDIGFPLTLDDNFNISIFAKDLTGARVIVQDSLGNFWVSQTSQGQVSLLTVEDGRVVSQDVIFQGLNKPHGLAIDPQDPFNLYIAQSDKISRVRIYSEGQLEKTVDLPDAGRHFSRTIGFGPDDRLYVSIGSSCDTCRESDDRRAAIYSMNKNGSDFKQFANGLRNAVFFTWSYVDSKMWATEMGRDFLGDDLPPDEINIVKESNDYGWPFCYGKNIQDQKFDNSSVAANFCQNEAEPSFVDLPAHSAPLGLGFIPEQGWPEKYWYDLLVAYHGSWNRTEPTGYKIVRVKLDEHGNFSGIEDFITGWLNDDGALGRPVDILIRPGGIMYLTDDKAGVVYKITYQ